MTTYRVYLTVDQFVDIEASEFQRDGNDSLTFLNERRQSVGEVAGGNWSYMITAPDKADEQDEPSQGYHFAITPAEGDWLYTKIKAAYNPESPTTHEARRILGVPE